MKKSGKIVLIVLSILAYLSLFFWLGLYYIGGLSYLYYTRSVVNKIWIFISIAVLVLLALLGICILMFKGRKVLRISSIVLSILWIPAAFFFSFIVMLACGIIGPYGCSYTEDVANFRVYDYEYNLPYFPEAITEDMTVVNYTYYYKYADTDQSDIYLEVKFQDTATMDTYLTAVKDAFSKNGFVVNENPYDPSYMDIFEIRTTGTGEKYISGSVRFDCHDDYKYVDMRYLCVTYSYDERTVIYNFTSIGSDIEIGNDPNNAVYYPKFLARFGVEWGLENNSFHDAADLPPC